MLSFLLTNVVFSPWVMSSSLWSHGLQHAKLPCPSLSPRIVQTHVHWISDALWPSHPLSPLYLLAPIFSSISLSQWVSSSHQVAKVLELLPQHQSFQWIFRISFRADWFDLLAVQGTLKSLLQHNDLEASVLQHWALFMVQLLHLYMTTRKQTLLGQKLLVLSLVWSVMLRSGWWLDLWMTAVKILRDTF